MSQGYSDYFLSLSNSSADPNGRNFFKVLSGSGVADPLFAGISHAEKVERLKQILQQKIHGISFSPYLKGQSPGLDISESQIAQRLNIIRPHTQWVRTFSCMEGNQEAPRIAHQQGLKTMVGVSIGKDKATNELELKNGIEVAQAGHANILAIGNEVLLRGDLNEDELLEYIHRAKQAVPDVLIGYVDAYFLFENHPRIADSCDVLLINCYPFWEMTPAEYALEHIKEMYQRALNVADGKQVIISETGWPSLGTSYGGAIPGAENALSYFISVYQWANTAGIELFYFSSFDEDWKQRDEGDVGANWGLWDVDGVLKYI